MVDVCNYVDVYGDNPDDYGEYLRDVYVIVKDGRYIRVFNTLKEAEREAEDMGEGVKIIRCPVHNPILVKCGTQGE